jgi:CTP-dependent riboflavin kinase
MDGTQNGTPEVSAELGLSGTVRAGRGLAATRMAEPALVQRLQELAGFSIVPGTLNLRLTEAPARGPRWQYLPAEQIDAKWQDRTGQAGYFLAQVIVAGQYRGLAFQADEPGPPGYPPDQIELFCEVNLRAALGLSDGDFLVVTVREA